MRTKGFTLIELMLVIVLMAILAAIAIPSFSNLIDRANDARTLGNLATLRAALSSYYAFSDGHYPSFPPPWGGPSYPGVGYNNPLLRNALVPKYISDIPIATPSGRHHEASNDVFHVWNQTGNGEDPTQGTGRGWKYDANPFDTGLFPGCPDFGSIVVMCFHRNSRGVPWSVL